MKRVVLNNLFPAALRSRRLLFNLLSSKFCSRELQADIRSCHDMFEQFTAYLEKFLFQTEEELECFREFITYLTAILPLAKPYDQDNEKQDAKDVVNFDKCSLDKVAKYVWLVLEKGGVSATFDLTDFRRYTSISGTVITEISEFLIEQLSPLIHLKSVVDLGVFKGDKDNLFLTYQPEDASYLVVNYVDDELNRISIQYKDGEPPCIKSALIDRFGGNMNLKQIRVADSDIFAIAEPDRKVYLQKISCDGIEEEKLTALKITAFDVNSKRKLIAAVDSKRKIMMFEF